MSEDNIEGTQGLQQIEGRGGKKISLAVGETGKFVSVGEARRVAAHRGKRDEQKREYENENEKFPSLEYVRKLKWKMFKRMISCCFEINKQHLKSKQHLNSNAACFLK